MEEEANAENIDQESLAAITNAALCSAAFNANFVENNAPVQPVTGDYYRQKGAQVMSWQERIKAITRECWARGFGKF